MNCFSRIAAYFADYSNFECVSIILLFLLMLVGLIFSVCMLFISLKSSFEEWLDMKISKRIAEDIKFEVGLIEHKYYKSKGDEK